MGSSDAYITKTGDTTPIVVYLVDRDGFVNLASATVVFNMRTPGGTLKVDRGSCTILDEDKGQVKYDFTLADVDTVGTYRGEFEVTFASGQVTTFPNEEYIPIKVISDLG